MISIYLAGAAGRMGQEAIRAIHESPKTRLVGATTHKTALGQDAGVLVGLPPLNIPLTQEVSLKEAPESSVWVDLSHGEPAYNNALKALEHRIPVVIGATGMSPEQIEVLSQTSQAQEVGVLIVPNFAMGAVLMMKFSAEASQYFEWAEIIEYHHENKRDAPSGTAIKTAQMMQKGQQGEEHPARGQIFNGIPIHSVRMPGKLAHQEVILGGAGQTLTLRHDSTDRKSFMPGLLLAVEKVRALTHLVYGLDQVI